MRGEPAGRAAELEVAAARNLELVGAPFTSPEESRERQIHANAQATLAVAFELRALREQVADAITIFRGTRG